MIGQLWLEISPLHGQTIILILPEPTYYIENHHKGVRSTIHGWLVNDVSQCALMIISNRELPGCCHCLVPLPCPESYTTQDSEFPLPSVLLCSLHIHLTCNMLSLIKQVHWLSFHCLGVDKVSMLTHTYPHKPWRKIKWPYASSRLTTHFMCGLMSDLVICKFRKSMVMHNTECSYWDQV